MNIKICYTPDNNYARPMAVSMASVLKNASPNDDLSFYILDGGISEENKLKIGQLKKIRPFEIKYMSIDVSLFSSFRLGEKYFTPAVYYRVLMADLLPDIDKIIYFDCDTVILSDLKELFETDVENFYLAAVEDIAFCWLRDRLGRKNQEFYINTGVMTVNLKLWRSCGAGQKLLKYGFEKRDEICFGDQDIINAVFKDGIKPLSLEWDVQLSFFEFNNNIYHPLKKEIKKAVKNPKIVHYVSCRKPWNSYVPLSDLYFYYQKFTAFDTPFAALSARKLLFQKYVYRIKELIYILRFIISPVIRVYKCGGKYVKIRLFCFFSFTVFKLKKKI